MSNLNKSCLSPLLRWVEEEVIWLDVHSERGKLFPHLLLLPSAAVHQVKRRLCLVGRIYSCRESVSVRVNQA